MFLSIEPNIYDDDKKWQPVHSKIPASFSNFQNALNWFGGPAIQILFWTILSFLYPVFDKTIVAVIKESSQMF